MKQSEAVYKQVLFGVPLKVSRRQTCGRRNGSQDSVCESWVYRPEALRLSFTEADRPGAEHLVDGQSVSMMDGLGRAGGCHEARTGG